MATIPDAELTAIYCRKSMKGDKKEITVNRQKRLALDDCERLGLIVVPHNVFVDNGASAWQRTRKRPGWDELIAACKRGEIKHTMCYHPDRLMRQPRDLEELLSISDEYGITLYGRLNERDLQDPDDRYALRIEIAHACRSSDDTSRRLKDQKQVPTAKGRAWTETSIRRQLQSKHVAGINVHRGQEIGVGKWPAIITRVQ
jgi:DNA invertase Pin-like site-specific DNA recombinase